MQHREAIDFVGIGAAKAGTTWLWKMLKQHPQIWFAKGKELDYFNPYDGEFPNKVNPRSKQTIAQYNQRFEGAPEGARLGEISTSYLKYPEVAHRLKVYNPEIKIFVILRDPIERALSHHRFLYSRGYEIPADFEEAIVSWPTLLSNSLYYQQLMPFLELFPRSNMCFLDFQWIKAKPQAFLDKVTHFLSVESFSPPNQASVINPSKEVQDPHRQAKVRSAHRMLQKTPIVNSVARRLGVWDWFNKQYDQNLKPAAKNYSLSGPFREQLNAYFAEDWKLAQALLQTHYP